MTEHHYEQMRRAMVASQLRTTGVDDARVIAAMGDVPRERYVPADRRALAYADRAVPMGDGRAMPEPMVLGRLLAQAQVVPSDRALVIGAGQGYAAAVLAKLAASVIALEQDAEHDAADGVERVSGPLAEGWPAGAPYSLILFDGAVEHVPQAIIDQLADGGRIAVATREGGVARLAIGRKVAGAFGLAPFADADVPLLPGFAIPRGFSF